MIKIIDFYLYRYCEYIFLYDLQDKTNWYFKCEQQFTVMEDYKAELIIKPSYPDKPVELPRKISRLRKLLFDTRGSVHTWNILQQCGMNLFFLKNSNLYMFLYRTDNVSFSYIKRFSVLLSIITSTYAFALILYGIPKFSLLDGFSYYGHYHMYGIVFLNANVSSVLSFAINMGIIMLFR